MRNTPRTLLLAAASLTAALLAAACTRGNPLTPGPKKFQVTVGSATFPENVLLADIYASALKAKGVKVAIRFNVGSREVLYQQVRQGSLTVLPESDGALLAYLDSELVRTLVYIAKRDESLLTKSPARPPHPTAPPAHISRHPRPPSETP